MILAYLRVLLVAFVGWLVAASSIEATAAPGAVAVQN
jgi:hypothetical protein